VTGSGRGQTSVNGQGFSLRSKKNENLTGESIFLSAIEPDRNAFRMDTRSVITGTKFLSRKTGLQFGLSHKVGVNCLVVDWSWVWVFYTVSHASKWDWCLLRCHHTHEMGLVFTKTLSHASKWDSCLLRVHHTHQNGTGIY
jgi:hypothetical protein